MPQVTETLQELLQRQAKANPAGTAILAPGRAELCCRDLSLFVGQIGQQLRDFGVCTNDSIAVVLPNGPEMATTFLATASAGISAPLNPGYLEGEFEFYLRDLNARLVIVGADMDSPVREVAARMGIPVADLVSEADSAAGLFTLQGLEFVRQLGPALTETDPADIALMLHTSGTTSQPRMVPLTHTNIYASARHIIETLQLSVSDRCLNVMPLFHIHGLIAALVSSLAAGGSVICAPGYREDQFFTCLGELKPTWYTAVPTIHQSILSAAAAQRKAIAATPLRFIRSSSAAIAPNIMHELEKVFGAPLIEAYGMTEAAHQVASNPLEPAMRKPRSVGLAAGPEIAIMDEAGQICAASDTGEIVIRGANVTTGYAGNAQANAEAFIVDWFRTGDQGYLDKDGYLFLTGRLKEIINRGGEKVSPREIDEVLMAHPEIGVAVGFAVPHPTLGEDVAAAVVLTEGSQLTEREVREFALDHLATFKVPSQVLIVDNIPEGPTGKLQRIALAEYFAEQLEGEDLLPENDLQKLVAETICEVLKLDRVGAGDNFFAIGGDSLTAIQVISRLNEVFRSNISIATLFRMPTVRELSHEISESVEVEDPALMEQLLAELENMPEAEALALLNQKSSHQ